MKELFKDIAPYIYRYWDRFTEACEQTWQLFLYSGIISFVLGLLFGVLLTITRKGGIKQNRIIFYVIDVAINIFRAIPFVILLIFLIPFTRSVVGTAIGVKGAIIPLVFGTVPFYSRQVETALCTVDSGKIEAARAMGSGAFGLIFRVYLKEAIPDLVRVTTITAISLIGLTTMAGAVGAGGLGSFAINYGQGLNHDDIVNVCVVVLLIAVCILQAIGSFLAKATTNRKLVKLPTKNNEKASEINGAKSTNQI